jgi:hypothetical protein
MSRSDIPTLLPLDTYAKLMGLNPLAFNQAVGHGAGGGEVFKVGNSQQAIWFQYDYQASAQFSRDSLAIAISRAERDIATYLGWWPAPIWTSQEVHRFPRPFLKATFGDGRDLRGQMKAVRASWGKVINGGQRAVTLLGEANKGIELVFSDEDNDGFDETATITLTNVTLTDVCEAKVYFSGKAGDPIWEVRPARARTLVAGTLTLIFDSWLFLDPDLQNAIPLGDAHPVIDADEVVSYVNIVDVYREYTDTTAPSAQFLWERQPGSSFIFCQSCGGLGCETCSYIAQDACLLPKDPHMGLVSTSPAEYDTDNEYWKLVNYAGGREPDIVKLWYRSGYLSQRSLSGSDCSSLDIDMAYAIAMLASARLDCDFNANNNVTQKLKALQRDYSESFQEGSTFFVEPSLLRNSFGTRLGELRAYKTLKAFTLSRDEKRIIQSAGVTA